MTKSRQRWAEIDARKAGRYAAEGKKQEGVIEELLRGAHDESGLLFLEVTRTESQGELDEQGCDFIVKRAIQGEVVERTFGVTISARSQKRAKARHAVPQFHVPIGFNAERFVKKIYDLF